MTRHVQTLHVGRERSAACTRPLEATLERVSALRSESGKIDLSARFGTPYGAGWIPVADLAGDGGFLDELLSRIERECGTKDRAFSGTALLRSVLWRVLTPTVAALLTERRLPDLRAENVTLRFGDGGFAEDLALGASRFIALSGDRDAEHPDAVVLCSEEEMLARLRLALAEGFLAQLIPALRGLRVRRGMQVLWTVASDVCAEAFMFVGKELGRDGEACALGRELTGAPPLSGPANYFVFEYEGGSMLTRVRNACCLYYKLGEGACFTCPRTSNEERSRRMEGR